MAYRFYFVLVPKERIEAIKKSVSLSDVCDAAFPSRPLIVDDEEPVFSVRDIEESTIRFEFGSDVSNTQFEAIRGEDKELPWFHDDDIICYVGNEETVKRAVIYFNDIVINNFKEDAEDKDRSFKSSNSRYVNSKDGYLVDLDLNNKELTSSYLFEHQIFNLVALYKFTDWSKYQILFAGW